MADQEDITLEGADREFLAQVADNYQIDSQGTRIEVLQRLNGEGYTSFGHLRKRALVAGLNEPDYSMTKSLEELSMRCVEKFYGGEQSEDRESEEEPTESEGSEEQEEEPTEESSVSEEEPTEESTVVDEPNVGEILNEFQIPRDPEIQVNTAQLNCIIGETLLPEAVQILGKNGCETPVALSIVKDFYHIKLFVKTNPDALRQMRESYHQVKNMTR